MIVKETQRIVLSEKTASNEQQRYGMQDHLTFALAFQECLRLRRNQALIHGNNKTSYTAIHATIQAFFEGALIPEAMPMCRPVEEAIKTHFGPLLLLPELSFAHPLGYGGKADLVAKSRHDFDGVCIDIKTKETEDISKAEIYPEHGMQLAAYRQGFNMPKARCANVFVGYKMVNGITQFTGVKVVEHEPDDLERYWLMFTKLLEFWQLKNNHK